MFGAVRSRFCRRQRSSQHDIWKLRRKQYKIYPDIVVVKDERQSSDANSKTRSVMERKMLWYLRFSRLLGCLFFSLPNGKASSRAAVAWKSPYTIYAFVWFCIAFVRRAFYMMSIMRETRGWLREFRGYVTGAFKALLWLKVFINYACFCLGSAKLLDFLQRATSFEKETSFTQKGRQMNSVSHTLFNFTLRATVAFCWVFLVLTFRWRTPSNPPFLKNLPVAREAMDFCGDVALFFYDFIVYGTIARCSEVLAEYINSEVERLESCRSAETSPAFGEESNPVSTVAAVRVNVSKIISLQTRLNELCSVAIATSTAAFLTHCCVYVYRFLMLSESRVHFWMAVAYMTHSALCLVDVAFVSEDLQREARKLKETAKGLAVLRPTNAYLTQVHYLHNTIEPEQMGLTGANFFRLDRGLLVKMAGAIITFGVILVQTGRDLSHPPSLHRGNVSAPIEGH